MYGHCCSAGTKFCMPSPLPSLSSVSQSPSCPAFILRFPASSCPSPRPVPLLPSVSLPLPVPVPVPTLLLSSVPVPVPVPSRYVRFLLNSINSAGLILFLLRSEKSSLLKKGSGSVNDVTVTSSRRNDSIQSEEHKAKDFQLIHVPNRGKYVS